MPHSHRSSRLHARLTLAASIAIGVAASASTYAQATAAPGPSAMPATASGEQIFRAACAACHGADGTGAPRRLVGFALPLPNGHDLPDFTDCSTNTPEPLADWVAVATRGGPVRGLDRHMPAFGDALSSAQIGAVVEYVRSFCRDPNWPHGDLNLPRAFFTEKAFPENELVWTTSLTTRRARAVAHALVYEHRLGARAQYEVTVPFAMQESAARGWARGLGDVEIAARRTFLASTSRGTIAAAGAAVTLPTGREREGLGGGVTILEPFAMFGQVIASNAFVQLHTGLEIPTDHDRAPNEGFVRAAAGYTFARDRGFGRAWTPMAELLFARPWGEDAEWDVVPQVQVSLSRLQHVLVSVGVRVPIDERQSRSPEVVTYLLWDWFDGGFFRFWK